MNAGGPSRPTHTTPATTLAIIYTPERRSSACFLEGSPSPRQFGAAPAHLTFRLIQHRSRPFRSDLGWPVDWRPTVLTAGGTCRRELARSGDPMTPRERPYTQPIAPPPQLESVRLSSTWVRGVRGRR